MMRRLVFALALAACGGKKEPAAPVEVHQVVTLTGVSMGADVCHIAVETDVGAQSYEGVPDLCSDRSQEMVGLRVVLKFDGDTVVEMLPQ